MSPFSRIPIWGAITVRVEGSQQNEDANMCLGHGIRVGWGKNEPESKGKSIYIPTEIWDHAGAFLHIITTVNCSLEVDEREVKKEAGFSAKLEGEEKKGNKHT